MTTGPTGSARCSWGRSAGSARWSAAWTRSARGSTGPGSGPGTTSRPAQRRIRFDRDQGFNFQGLQNNPGTACPSVCTSSRQGEASQSPQPEAPPCPALRCAERHVLVYMGESANTGCRRTAGGGAQRDGRQKSAQICRRLPARASPILQPSRADAFRRMYDAALEW
jgi:hypothetical protein